MKRILFLVSFFSFFFLIGESFAQLSSGNTDSNRARHGKCGLDGSRVKRPKGTDVKYMSPAEAKKITAKEKAEADTIKVREAGEKAAKRAETAAKKEGKSKMEIREAMQIARDSAMQARRDLITMAHLRAVESDSIHIATMRAQSAEADSIFRAKYSPKPSPQPKKPDPAQKPKTTNKKP